MTQQIYIIKGHELIRVKRYSARYFNGLFPNLSIEFEAMSYLPIHLMELSACLVCGAMWHIFI